MVAAIETAPFVTTQTVDCQTIHYQILHWMPGRFRIRIPRLAWDEEYGSRLKYLVDSLSFVSATRISLESRSIVVEYRHEATAVGISLVQEKLFRAIQDAPMVDIDKALTAISSGEKKANNEVDWTERLGFPVAGLVLSLAAMVGAPIPPLLIGAVVFIGAIPVFQRAWDAIQEEGQLTIDFLDGLAIALHTATGHFFAPSFMLGLVEGGEAIRDMTARGSERASLDLLDCLGKTAFVMRDGQIVEIPTEQVVLGDHVIVYPGDQIPVDGAVLEGTGILDQCKLTGESVPVTRSVGEEVFASTLLVDGTLTILAERCGNNTRAGVIVNLMQSAPVHDTRVENYAAAVANQMVIPTLLIGAGVGIFSGNLNRAIALLTLDFGTGIRVSVPTTILSVLTYAARNGVLIRSGRAIEILAKIDTVVCDKTGTLTIGHAGVNDIDVMADRFSKHEILCYAASAEKGLTHPIAEAIVHHARDEKVALKECEEWEYKVGLGAFAKIDDMIICVGSPRFMKQENIDLEAYDLRYPDAKVGGQSLVYVAGDGQLLGVIRYSDPPREESKAVIRELKQMGITTHMLTGDVSRVAHSIAGNLGIDPKNVTAEAFPEKKVEVVKEVHDRGRTVAFCGDGINDSAALAYADVSISFAGATDIARETADVVLMEDDLRGLIMAIKCARQAMDIITQNTLIVAVPNLGALVSGIFFALDPLLAVVINNGTAILAELNGLRPLIGPGENVMPATHQISPADLVAEEQRLREMAAEFQQIRERKEQDAIAMSPASEPASNGNGNGYNGHSSAMSPASAPASNGNGNGHNGHSNGHSNGNGNGVVNLPITTIDVASHPPQISVKRLASDLEPLQSPSCPLPPLLGMLKQSDLAKRFGVTHQVLSRQRSKPDFTAWSQAHDPEGISWFYEPATRCFYTVTVESHIRGTELSESLDTSRGDDRVTARI